MITPRLFNALPGNLAVRIVLTTVIVIAIVAVLFEWVFPWASTWIPYQDQTVE